MRNLVMRSVGKRASVATPIVAIATDTTASMASAVRAIATLHPKSKMKHLFHIFAAMLCIVCASCTRGTIYSHYEPLPLEGWEADSVLSYEFAVADTLSAYDIVLNLRHSENYPNQNFWVFASLWRDSVCISSDTLDYFLADQRGRWLGNGFGSRRDMPMLYKRSLRFPLSGDYRICLQHGMREPLLRGVSDMGVSVSLSEE